MVTIGHHTFDTKILIMLISHYGQFGLKKGGAIMLTITEIAAGKVKEVMASQNKDNSLLRLYIAGFG